MKTKIAIIILCLLALAAYAYIGECYMTAGDHIVKVCSDRTVTESYR